MSQRHRFYLSHADYKVLIWSLFFLLPQYNLDPNFLTCFIELPKEEGIKPQQAKSCIFHDILIMKRTRGVEMIFMLFHQIKLCCYVFKISRNFKFILFVAQVLGHLY